MKCIFCSKISGDSKTVEHIIPESLGNTEYILPKGVVCDKCNNYFAVEVEKPFIELESINSIRFQQNIINKRGRTTSVDAMLNFEYPISLVKDSIIASDNAVRSLLNTSKGQLVIRLPQFKNEKTKTISRFLSKVAIEAMAEKLLQAGLDYEMIINHPDLKKIKDHARGYRILEWPVSIRYIDNINPIRTTPDGDYEQVIFEYEIIKTENDEYYFAFTYFGVELVINYGEPSIEGYLSWVKENGK